MNIHEGYPYNYLLLKLVFYIFGQMRYGVDRIITMEM